MSRELISPEGLRTDGRRAQEFRQTQIRLGAFAWNASGNSGGGGVSAANVDGAAFYSQGHTRVLAFVIGPREPKKFGGSSSSSSSGGALSEDKATITCEYCTASFSFSERKQVSKADRRSTELALLLRQTFESVILTSLYPSSHISLHVQILQNDGGAFACAINALTLALTNAGIPMKDMICASTVGLYDTIPILDLNFNERSIETPEITVASMVHSRKIVLIQEENKMNLKALQGMVELALEGNGKLYQILQKETQSYSEAILRSRGLLNA